MTPGQLPERRPAPDPDLEADRVALEVRALLLRLALPLAQAARSFVRCKGWFPFGYARLDDHARERFGRSGRWVRDMAALGEACASLPELRDAVTGDDGGRPLGLVAALLVSRAATPESLPEWIEAARSSTVRALRRRVREARDAGSCRPPSGSSPPTDAPGPDGAEPDPGERMTLRLPVPPEVQLLFDEALDLYRAVVGTNASVTSFIEALTAEAAAGLADPGDASLMPPAGGRPPAATAEDALARSTRRWKDLPDDSPDDGLHAAALLGAATELVRRAGWGDAPELDEQIRGLLAVQADLERRLGDLLASMSRAGAWHRLRFAGLTHYGEERLGMSRTSVADAAGLARAFERFPRLQAAHRAGRVGSEAARVVARILGRAPVEEALEKAWVERAAQATVKRLRDEAHLVRRERVRRDAELLLSPAAVAEPGAEPRPAAGPGAIFPFDDAVWFASLRREPGSTRERLARLARQLVAVLDPVVFQHSTCRRRDPRTPRPPSVLVDPGSVLRLTLPADLARSLISSMLAYRGALFRALQAGVGGDDPPASLAVGRAFARGLGPLPRWAGLLALLEEFIHVWDDPEGMPRRAADAIYMRDGYRCTAPGCTSRRHLEDHHIVYRSRGGGDEEENRLCACRFHHQRGEHGGLARVRGRAPLDVRWRLGRRELGVWFRNERRVVQV